MMPCKQLSAIDCFRNRCIFLYLLGFFSLSACAQTHDWNGIYTYDASLGENVAEDKIVIEYVFELGKDRCLVTSQGYQTDEKILCTTEASDEHLVVKFTSYENGSTKNSYGVETYPLKSTLFTLTFNNSTLITTWGVLAPDKSISTGEHFKRTADE